MEQQDTNAASMEETMEESGESGFLEGLEEQPQTEGGAEEGEAEEEAQGAEEEGEAKPQTEEEQKAPEREKAEDAGTVRLVFNGEEKEVSVQKAAELAQKGVDYDCVSGERDRLRASVRRLEAELAAPRGERAAFAVLSQYARANGMSPQDVLSRMSEAAEAKGFAAPKLPEGESSKYFAERAREDWKDFLRAYPEIRDPKEELPPEVWQQIAGGLTPRAAYIEYRAQQAEKEAKQKDEEILSLKAQIETMRKNEENRRKSPGSAAGAAGAANAKRDPFLEGLFDD